jgi:hypothetical protein
MERRISRALLTSATFFGLMAAVVTTPAHSGMYEVSVPDETVRVASGAPGLNLDMPSLDNQQNAWAGTRTDWRDPRPLGGSSERQRRIEPLFVVKF